MDDVLVGGVDQNDCHKRVVEVLNRFERHGLCVNQDKYFFFVREVRYLGYLLTEEGLKPCPEKVDAIKKAPAPSNVTEVKAFVALLAFYAWFLPDLAATLGPLYALLKKDKKWQWSPECQSAVDLSKKLLCTADVIVLYDPSRSLRVTADASSYGLGAVLTQDMGNGDYRPVEFASRTLTAAEQNYAQVERKALALVFAVKKFHKYLFGHHFTLVTDHHPLTSILGPNYSEQS